jgi:hypothetical protein
MKLSVTQVILGVLIIVTTSIIVWWMTSGVQELLDEKVLNESGEMVQDYTPEHEVLFTIARYVSGILLMLGLSVVVTGALWKKIENKKKLAVTQIVLSTLIVVLSIFILFWGYSFNCIVPIEGGPILAMSMTKALTLITVILGIVILITGIIQLGQTRKAERIRYKEE